MRRQRDSRKPKFENRQMIFMEDHLPTKLQVFAGDMDTMGLSYCMDKQSEFNPYRHTLPVPGPRPILESLRAMSPVPPSGPEVVDGVTTAKSTAKASKKKTRVRDGDLADVEVASATAGSSARHLRFEDQTGNGGENDISKTRASTLQFHWLLE